MPPRQPPWARKPSSHLSSWECCSAEGSRGLTCAVPLCWPGPGRGRGAGPGGGHSVPNTESGGAPDAPGLEGRVHLPGVGWPGVGMWPVETFGAGTPLLQAFGASATAKPECARCHHTGRAHRHTQARHVCPRSQLAQARVLTAGLLFPATVAGLLRLASRGPRLGAGGWGWGGEHLTEAAGNGLPEAPMLRPLSQPSPRPP